MAPGNQFHEVDYEGSTRYGFSGAPYVVAGRVVGMHQSSSTRISHGVATSYVHMLLRRRTNRQEESSDDLSILWRQLRGAKGKVKTRELLDEVEVFYNGKYYRVDRDEWNSRMQEDDYDDFMDAGDEGLDYGTSGYVDGPSSSSLGNLRRKYVVKAPRQLENAQGNEQRPQVSGALPALELRTLPQLIQSLNVTMDSSAKNIQENIAGPLQGLTQSLLPLKDTLSVFTTNAETLKAQTTLFSKMHSTLSGLVTKLDTTLGSLQETEKMLLSSTDCLKNSISKDLRVSESSRVSKPSAKRSGGTGLSARIEKIVNSCVSRSLTDLQTCMSGTQQNQTT